MFVRLTFRFTTASDLPVAVPLRLLSAVAVTHVTLYSTGPWTLPTDPPSAAVTPEPGAAMPHFVTVVPSYLSGVFTPSARKSRSTDWTYYARWLVPRPALVPAGPEARRGLADRAWPDA